VRLATHLPLVAKLTIRGVIPPILRMPFWSKVSWRREKS